MSLYCLDVLYQQLLTPLQLFATGKLRDSAGLLVLIKWNLGVDGQRLASGQVDNHVCPAGLIAGCDGCLLREVSVFDETSQFHQLSKLSLSPDSPEGI